MLVIHLDHLGDVCTLIPSVTALSKTFNVDIVCNFGLEEVWKTFLPKARIFPLHETVWSSKKIREQIPTIFHEIYEAVFVPTIAPFSCFLGSLAASDKRYGMIENGKHFKGSSIIFDNIHNAASEEHVSLRFRKLFELYPKVHLDLNQSPVSHHHSMDSYTLIHPGGKWKPRRWPKERFVQVAQALSKKGHLCKILIHENERELLEFFTKNDRSDNGFSIIVTKSTSDLINAVQKCSLFIGNDSGPAHLANLYQKNSIILWGPGNYERIRPLGSNNTILIHDIDCRPCRQYKNPDSCQRGENLCLLNISVQNVLDVLQENTL